MLTSRFQIILERKTVILEVISETFLFLNLSYVISIVYSQIPK